MESRSNAQGINLRHALPNAEWTQPCETAIRACTADVKSVRPGDAFVAMLTEEGDGIANIAEAVQRGAACVVTEQPTPTSQLPAAVVPDAREAYGTLCQALVGNPTSRIACVGVTGTDGKTSTTRLIGAILSAGGVPTGRLDDLTPAQVNSCSKSSAITFAPTLARQLSEMEANRCSHAVLEASSRALAQRQLAGIEFDIACFTNLRRAHLDLHNTPESYRQAKARLMEQLDSGGLVVLNADDPASGKLASKACGPVFTFGIERPADVTATVVETNPAEQTFLLSTPEETIPVRTRMIGQHHVENCLAAATVGLAVGMDLPTIAQGLESVTTLPERLQRLDDGSAIRVYLDRAATPTALAAGLKAVRQHARRLWCVLSVNEESDRDCAAKMGRTVQRLADAGLVTSNCHDTNLMPSDLVDVSAHWDWGQGLYAYANREEAIETAISSAQPGDVVLITGTRHVAEQQSNIQQDCLVARNVLIEHPMLQPPRSAAA